MTETRQVPRDHSNARHVLYARAMDELYLPREAPIIVPLGEKDRLYDLARGTIGDGVVTYLEFGVHMGWSITRIMHRFKNPDSKFVGFDSFVGLPEMWSESMDQGHFSTKGAPPEVTDPRASFVTGWFQNTVPRFLAGRPISTSVLVHFDADLYSSTLFLLTTLWHHIADYWFIFDEFQPDEIIAMYDFVKAYPTEFEFIGATLDEHSRPQQVFGRMRRVPMVVDGVG